MKRENTKLKLLYLREILLKYSDQDHPLTAGDLEKKLESYGCQAERKSIYNDINALIESGMDIIKSQSPPGFFVGSREFELAELKILVDAVISSKFITGKKSEKLVEKLSSLASDAEKRELC
ncbi:MAG TPA: WYL domain-containing protein, partial [Bacillota bacterium]|nr:WYL domain-containing protein [Bacillota bacterium]